MLSFRDCTLHSLEKTFGVEQVDTLPALDAMLVAQELNEHRHPIYGAYIIGADWYFMALQGKQYAVSTAYVAARDDVFDIFRILKVLKQLIDEYLR